MEIRDPVHGSIHILDEEIAIIQNAFFQRLRNIKQLGFSEYVFPGATHTRFLHSIGVMHISGKAFDKLFQKHIPNKDIARLKETLRMACLLHDIGHAPLSHSTEMVMPKVSKLQLPKRFQIDSDRRANHEDYTIKAIVDSSLTASFSDLQRKYEISPNQVADLVIGHTDSPEYFTIAGVNYFPLLHQLVSSELDCDRMDYLLHDSYFCGVSYGNYDLDWLIDNLEACIMNNQAYLGISERAVVTFDDFLLSRYHMFLMVYFHYRSVCLEQLLSKYFQTSDEYQIPVDIAEYLEHDDHYLMKVLRNSKNRYAQAIVQNKIPAKIYESFNEAQHQKLTQIQNFLEEEKIEYISSSSSGRLSKYYAENIIQNKFPIKVFRTEHGQSRAKFIDIGKATDLFQKFSKSHAVNRLHCDLDALNNNQRKALLDFIQGIN